MSVASLYTLCFVMFCVFLYGPFCRGAHKLDLSTLFTTFFLWTSLPFIFKHLFEVRILLTLFTVDKRIIFLVFLTQFCFAFICTWMFYGKPQIVNKLKILCWNDNYRRLYLDIQNLINIKFHVRHHLNHK